MESAMEIEEVHSEMETLCYEMLRTILNFLSFAQLLQLNEVIPNVRKLCVSTAGKKGMAGTFTKLTSFEVQLFNDYRSIRATKHFLELNGQITSLILNINEGLQLITIANLTKILPNIRKLELHGYPHTETSIRHVESLIQAIPFIEGLQMQALNLSHEQIIEIYNEAFDLRSFICTVTEPIDLGQRSGNSQIMN